MRTGAEPGFFCWDSWGTVMTGAEPGLFLG